MPAPPRRIRIDLAYDGTAFAGWQAQPAARTVQGTLEDALGRVSAGLPVRVRGAGRTDAGVHARGQVADAAVAVALDDEGLTRALSGILPADLRPVAVRTVDDRFNARRDALWKTYAYQLDRSAHGDPMAARYALHAPGGLDRAAIDDGLRRLPGTRDWSGFAGAACEVEDRVRTLFEARWLDLGPSRVALVFRGDGFLTHMVRNLVGTLLAIGRGRFEPGRIDAVLAAGDRRIAGPTAPPHGLCLVRVAYPGESGGEFPGDTMRDFGVPQEDP